MNAIVPPRRITPAWLEQAATAFLSRFDGLRGRLPGNVERRDAGASAFRRNGLPGPRDEDWHYTNLRALAEIRFAEPLTPVADCAALLARLPMHDAPRLVFVDGRFREDLSIVPAVVAVRVGAPSYGPLAQPERERMVALNTMLAEDGATIEVPDGADGGLLILAILGTGAVDRPVAFHPRHSVRLGAGAALTLFEVAVGAGAYLHNTRARTGGRRGGEACASADAGRSARGVPCFHAVRGGRRARDLRQFFAGAWRPACAHGGACATCPAQARPRISTRRSCSTARSTPISPRW